jgi:hypothetical protein
VALSGGEREREGLDARRVGLFRALLVAHGQMMVNRTKKGLGRRGLAGLVIIVLFLLLGAAPLFGTFGFLGFIFGRGIDEPIAAPLMGGILTASAVGFGVIGGMLGGARQLTWEAYRSFPVPFRTLFFAETFASLGDLVVLAFVGVALAMGGAFAWQAPELSPLVALLLVQLVLWVVFAQHLVGSLAVSAVRRLRRAMVVLAVATWAGVSVLAGAARELSQDLQGAEVARLRDLWHRVKPLVEAFPPVLSVRAMAAAQAWLELPTLAVTLLLGATSYAVLRRETQPDGFLAPAPSARRQALEARLSPRWAVAWLQLRYVAGSLQGRFGMVVPLIVVVIIKGPVGTAGIGAAYTLPGSVIYLALSATQFHNNQFGLDGQGVKTLFLLPVSTRDLLLGKTYGILAYCAAQNALLFVLLGFLLRPGPREVVAGVLLAGCVAMAHVIEGHWISALYPRPLAMHRMNPSGLSGANLLPLGIGMANGAVFGGFYALVSWVRPDATALALLPALLLLVAAYREQLPRAAAFVEGHRERLVEVLG